MIKAVANKKIYLDKPEYDYLLELKSMFGDDCFNDLFSTNDSGFITLITPPPNRHTPLAVMFFLLNVMMNQRLRDIDSFSDRLNSISDRLSLLEELK